MKSKVGKPSISSVSEMTPAAYSYIGNIHIKFGLFPRNEFKHKRPGTNKISYESVSGFDITHSGEIVEKRRVINRENNLYFEKVVEYKSGKELRRIEEPLTDHIGRGSAKTKSDRKNYA